MKQLFLLAVCYFSFAVHGKSQQNIPVSDTIKVILENDKVKVTEYVSNPGKIFVAKETYTCSSSFYFAYRCESNSDNT